MSLKRTISKGACAIALAGSMLCGGLVFATGAGATVKPTPDEPCIILGGQTICGSVAYLDGVEADATNAANAVTANKTAVNKGDCATIQSITSAIGVMLVFMPEAAIVAYISAAVAGVSAAEIVECEF